MEIVGLKERGVNLRALDGVRVWRVWGQSESVGCGENVESMVGINLRAWDVVRVWRVWGQSECVRGAWDGVGIVGV